jgi:hypothetical protein
MMQRVALLALLAAPAYAATVSSGALHVSSGASRPSSLLGEPQTGSFPSSSSYSSSAKVIPASGYKQLWSGTPLEDYVTLTLGTPLWTVYNYYIYGATAGVGFKVGEVT